MKKYMKPELDVCVIEEEDVILGSGTTLPPDEFGDVCTTKEPV